MRIAHWIRALVAVLGFAAVFPFSLPVDEELVEEHFNSTLQENIVRSKRSPRKHHHNHLLYEGWNEPFYTPDYQLLYQGGHFLNQRENQMLLRKEFADRNKTPAECCPSVLEMVEPDGGKNQYDQYVELYRDGDYRQRFYELSCHQDILDKPCRFMDRKLHEHSRCVQKYSYTYALVKDPGRHHHQRPKNFPSFPAAGPGGSTWTLDYIRVRSGCGCVVTPNGKKKRDRLKKKKLKNDDVER